MNETHPRSILLSVLSHRPFLFLWFGQIFSQLALNSLLFVLALIIYQKTGSNAAVSGLFLSYGVPAVLFGMIAGAIVDRLDRRSVLIMCDIIRAWLALLLFFSASHVGVMYLIVFVSAVINQFYVPSEAPLIPRFVPKTLLVSANSLFSFTFYTSMGIGFIVAGPLIRQFGGQWSILVIAVLFLIAAIMVSRIPVQGGGVRSLTQIFSYRPLYIIERILSSLREGLVYVARSPILFDALMLLTGTQVMLALLGTLGPGFADRVLEIDVRDVSWVVVGPTVLGIIIGALWVGQAGFRFGAQKLIRTGIMSAGIILILISLTVRLSHYARWLVPAHVILPLELALFFLLGVSNALLDVPANSLLQSQASGQLRGRVYGMLTASVGGVGILPVVIGGVLADVIGVGKVIFFLGILIVIYGIYRMKYNTL